MGVPSSFDLSINLLALVFWRSSAWSLAPLRRGASRAWIRSKRCATSEAASDEHVREHPGHGDEGRALTTRRNAP